ncbi:hypothetical protein IF650_07215 [Cellulosimicrobium terreum]|nr:hypothetical protein [Cellulosimicrobium terreum]
MSPRPVPAARAARVRVPVGVRRALLGVAVGVVGLVVGTALAGGLDRHEAATGAPTTAAAGQGVATGAFELTVTSWGIDRVLEPDRLTDLGADAWLVVDVDVLDTDRVTRTLDATAVTLPDPLPGGLELVGDPPPTRPETTLLVRDGSAYPMFQPGLPEQVLVMWPVRGELDGRPDLDLTLPTFVYRDMFVGGGRRWAETGESVLVPAPYGPVPEVEDPSADADELWDDTLDEEAGT